MDTKTSVLLILRERQGIDYNTLLNRLASSYSSVSSARAALSRALRNLSALGMIVRRGKRIYITDKGLANIGAEMREKLLIKLNKLLGSRQRLKNIDKIVELLATMVERIKAEQELLKAAKIASDFYIADLIELKKDLRERARQLNYFAEILEERISELKKMDFNDRLLLPFADSKQLISSINKFSDAEYFSVELHSDDAYEEIINKFNLRRSEQLSLKLKHWREFVNFITAKGFICTAFVGKLKIIFSRPFIAILGPYSLIEKIKKEKTLG